MTSLAATLMACSPEKTDEDPGPVAWATLEEWQDLTGVLRPGLSISVEYRPGHIQGEAQCWAGNRATIRIFQGSFEADGFERIVRHTMLHELAHAHLRCSNADHTDDPSSLMYPYWTLENLDALPDRDAVRERWIRP